MNQQLPQKQSSSTLLVLCILSLLGSIFIFLKGLISYTVLLDSNDTRSEFGKVLINVVYILEFLSCIGSIAGAIIMLIGKRAGLLIYLISCGLYILVTFVFAVFCFVSIIGIPVGLLQFFYIIPSILFFVLYLNQGKYLR
jgi:hypothetical protein